MRSPAIMSPVSLIRKVETTITRHGLVRDGERILVAVSGGADSVALLGALHAIAARWSFRLHVAHLDHGLRGDAGVADRTFVEELAGRFELPIISDRVEVPPGADLEARAREMRYRFLGQAARATGSERIAVAHTQSDQAETVLMRLLRGAGTRGLAGMSPRRGRVVRPLLDCTRDDVVAFLQERGLSWVEDETNRDERFTRSRLRRRLLPALIEEAGPRIVPALARTAELLRADDRYLDATARQVFAPMAGRGGLDGAALGAMDAAIRRRVLRMWLAAMRGTRRGIGRLHVSAIEEVLAQDESRLVALPDGWVRWEAGSLTWERALLEAPAAFTIPVAPGTCVLRDDLGWELALSEPEPWPGVRRLPHDHTAAVFDHAQLPGELVLRSVQPGDRIRPLGVAGSQKVQDVFVNGKIPRSIRPRLPLLAAGPQVLWVPGLSRSDIATVRRTTTAVVWVDFRPLGSAG